MTAPVFISGGGIGSLTTPLAIKSGGKDILASGTVIVYSTDLEFNIAQLRVVMEFVSDDSSTRVESAAVGTTTLNLKLFNFNSSVGSSTTDPMQFGTFAGRQIFLSFMVFAISGGNGKTVHYTFTLGEHV